MSEAGAGGMRMEDPMNIAMSAQVRVSIDVKGVEGEPSVLVRVLHDGRLLGEFDTARAKESSSKPPRPDLAIGALQVAMGTTTDPEVKPWLQTALDFLTGEYEPLDEDTAS